MRLFSDTMSATIHSLHKHRKLDIMSIHANTLAALSTRGMVTVTYARRYDGQTFISLSPLGRAFIRNWDALQQAPRYRLAQRFYRRRKHAARGSS